MSTRSFAVITTIIILWHSVALGQSIEKIIFDSKDSTAGYYLAVRPKSTEIKGVMVLLTSFASPESLLPETKLHNVAYVNDILTVVVFMKQKLYADSFAIHRMNTILKDVVQKFAADTSSFVLAGYDEAGIIALRYTELTYQHPGQHSVQPKAVFCIDAHVDLFGLWRWSEAQIKKNYYAGATGDAKYYLDVMTKENGGIRNNHEKYASLTPFDKDEEATGNEQYLRNVPVRLYYDTDIGWQLTNRRNSYYDTKMPDGSELIKRLLLSGNDKAEFIPSKQPGLRSNGIRHPNALSIVDEAECIQWIKKCLQIFDANTWIAPYHLVIPKNWSVEHFSLPPDFARGFTYHGVEDIRFAPGWGDSTSEDYWSYAYVWWLNENTRIDAEGLQNNVRAYYTGLVERNITGRSIPANKVIPTTVTLKKIKRTGDDIETYGGTVRMLDYMTQRPVVLNFLAHEKDCQSQKHKALFIEISPKPAGHPIWQQFNKIDKEFRCSR